MKDTSQLIKDIKKLNERVKELYKTFGDSQKEYQSIVNFFSHIDDTKLRLNSKGYYSFSHGKKFVESLNNEQIEYIEKALQVQTKGELIKEEVETQKFLNPSLSRKELREKAIVRIKEKNYQSNLIKDNLDLIYADSEMSKIIHRKGRRLYQTEFEKIKNYIQEMR